MVQITATHQLEFAISNLALAARPILLASSHIRSPDNPSSIQMGGFDGSTKLNSGVITSLANCKKTLMDAMFDTLPGLDANDPNKTLATLQLYCSVLSSVSFVWKEIVGISNPENKKSSDFFGCNYSHLKKKTRQKRKKKGKESP
jgi:proteasome activator subunit 4